MLPLPDVARLAEAVRRVIESNINDGYQPSRFIQATENGYAKDVQSVAERLITKGETLEYIEAALQRHPMLLTREDSDARFGDQWGFSDEAIRDARERSAYFDKIAGARRFE